MRVVEYSMPTKYVSALIVLSVLILSPALASNPGEPLGPKDWVFDEPRHSGEGGRGADAGGGAADELT